MNALYHVQFQPYQFPLPFPLTTVHGQWTIREGIIIRLTNDQGQTAQGEIAPLPWFGTEDLAQATNFCQQLNGWITLDQIQTIGEGLPCCQFAFGSAAWQFREPLDPTHHRQALNYCHLLPTGEAALDYLKPQTLTPQTVKWKIGVQSPNREQALFLELLEKLPPKTRLRLDANGGLTFSQAKQWLTLLDRQREISQPQIRVEYLEQPLAPDRREELFALAQDFQTAIALDESVASYQQLQTFYEQRWPGIYILKAAIMGDPRRLHHWLSTHPIRAIFSSVFETAIARERVLGLARQWNLKDYAVGFNQNWEPVALTLGSTLPKFAPVPRQSVVGT